MFAVDCTAFSLLRELAECAMKLAKDNDKVSFSEIAAESEVVLILRFHYQKFRLQGL
jgi:hypothetical protein